MLCASAFIIAFMMACTRKGLSPSPEVPAAEEPVTPVGTPLKIGVLLSTTGTFSISESPMLYAAKMALDEINAAGGINGSFSGLEIQGPAGRVKMDENNHHAWLPCYIGRINNECTFDIVYRSNGLIAPALD